MSWQDVTPVNARTALGMVNYSYSLKLGARVTLPASVGSALKWKAGHRIRLQVGADEHAGMLRLVADENGPLNVRACRTTALQVHIGKLDALPSREVKRCTVRHEVDASALTITLPSHAQALLPAARPAQATGGGSSSVILGPAPKPPAGGAKVDVVDKVVGGTKSPPRFAAASGTRP